MKNRKVLYIEIPPQGFTSLNEPPEKPISLASAIMNIFSEQRKIEESMRLNNNE